MMKWMKAVLVVLGLGITCVSQTAINTALDHPAFSGNLPEVLRSISQRYEIPIIAELSQPLPLKLSLAEGRDSAQDLLKEVIKADPKFDFEILPTGVVHFYSAEIERSRTNFLNLHFRQFTMPPTVSDLKLLLPARMNSLRNGLNGSGVVTSGFGSSDLQKLRLTPEELSNVTGRDVLIKAAGETHGFFCIVIFPSTSTPRNASEDYAFRHWFWGAARAQTKEPPIYVQPPPK